MNKIFKTALTTVVLLGMAQDGWGTTSVTLTSEADIKNNSSKDEDGSTYTLKTGNNYLIKTGTIVQTTNTSVSIPILVIPSGVTVTYDTKTVLGVEYYLGIGDGAKLINQGTFSTNKDKTLQLTGGGTLENTGTFNNNGILIGNKNTNIKNNSGTFTNNGKIKVVYNVGAGPLTISNVQGATFTNENNIFVDASTSSSTLGTCSLRFSENGDITNRGSIYATNKKACTIEFLGGSTEKPQMVTTQGTSSSPGQIYLDNSNASMTIGTNSILSFGEYGKFYSNNSGTSVTLNGTISINSTNASVDVSKMNISGSGTIDMSPLRPYPEEYSDDLTTTKTFEDNDFFIFDSSQSLPNIKLPFNCKFNTQLNLSKANKVYYTILQRTGAGIDNNIIKKIVNIYGDYANNSSLGVNLPPTTDVTTKTSGEANMYLSALAADTTTYNILGAGYKLLTDDLDDAAQTISADTPYNFGFKGTTAISITGSGKAVFNGDNSEYNPSSTMTLPNNVEFGASNSLFQFTKTYVHGTFTAGNYTNTIPAGKIVTFTGGFSLGAGHTLIVRGTLIG